MGCVRHVQPMSFVTGASPTATQPVYHSLAASSLGGTAGFTTAEEGAKVYLADISNDGHLDLLVRRQNFRELNVWPPKRYGMDDGALVTLINEYDGARGSNLK